MPIRIDNDLPVKKILEDENIFVMDENRSNSQDIRPIDILILNLMPLKENTELELLRSLSNTPLQVNISFIRTSSYESKHTSKEHLHQFYRKFKEVRSHKWDGLIITGAPVEKLDFEEVEYWPERIGDTVPYDLDKWPKRIDEWAEQVAAWTSRMDNLALDAERVDGGVKITLNDGTLETPKEVVVNDGEVLRSEMNAAIAAMGSTEATTP